MKHHRGIYLFSLLKIVLTLYWKMIENELFDNYFDVYLKLIVTYTKCTYYSNFISSYILNYNIIALYNITYIQT